jgi:hypothetical protein
VAPALPPPAVPVVPEGALEPREAPATIMEGLGAMEDLDWGAVQALEEQVCLRRGMWAESGNCCPCQCDFTHAFPLRALLMFSHPQADTSFSHITTTLRALGCEDRFSLHLGHSPEVEPNEKVSCPPRPAFVALLSHCLSVLSWFPTSLFYRCLFSVAFGFFARSIFTCRVSPYFRAFYKETGILLHLILVAPLLAEAKVRG